MAIREIEYLKDRVRVVYNLQKPFGIPDVRGESKDILYSDIPNLPLVPETPQEGVLEKRERIPINILGKTIWVIFHKWQETCSGPLEEVLYGVFLEKAKK